MQSNVNRPRFPDTPSVIILTGSTGFLGQALLTALIADPKIEKVYCIGVRNLESRKTLSSSRKVAAYGGDLTLPRLGLSSDEADVIFGEADRIIHNGADVSHLKTYQSLRLANLQSTKELIEMSLRRQIPIYYVSTAAVCIYSGEDVFGEISAAQDPPPIDGLEGYTASKWASERFLEKVHKHCEWPVTILRPSSIGREEAPNLDLTHNLLKYSRLMQAVPVSPNMRGFLNLVSLESVVQSTMLELHRNPIVQLRYVHQIGDIDVPLDNLKDFLDKDGGTVVELSIDEWATRAESLGLHKMLVALLVRVAISNVVNFPRLSKDMCRN